ncbi:FAD-binding domain [Mycobacterium sp. pUA109]|uniref:FAD-binding domain n=1 Tax=Mycobacterium sp. pUA109 TaxID=3238982 RepID=UPI00351ABFEC
MKIAVCGAGIAGPTLAYWLRHGGHEPTLIEKAPQLRTGGYVIDFWGSGYAIAERMGLAPAVQAAGYAVQEVRLVDRRGRTVGEFPVAGFRHNFGGRFTSLPRGDLAALIYQAIEGSVETIFNDSIVGIDQHDDGVQVTFERGKSRRFDLVIGAGGVHSPVRALVFGPDTKFQTALGYQVAAFAVNGYQPREELVYVAYTAPRRMAARFALRDDRTMFLLVYANDARLSADRDSPHDGNIVLRHVFGDAGWECPRILSELDRVGQVYFDQVTQVTMERWSKGRVALIGDAASCVSLLAGEGTGLAMLQAYVLAGELNAAGGDHREAFHRYEKMLRPLIEAKQRSARSFASAFAPKTPLGLWTRNQASKLLGVPRLADWIIRREFRDEIELPAYPT